MKKIFSNRIISVVSSVLASVMAVSLVGYAASTISTNISTGGTLTVTGTATAEGTVSFTGTAATTTISGGLRADTSDNTLVVDFSGSRVGVGTTSPSVLMSVHGNTILGSADASIVSFRAGDLQLNSNATTTISTKNLMGINVNSGDLVLDTESNKLYVGSSTPIRGSLSVDGSGTTTIAIGTTSATTGSCIEIVNALNGATMRMYATSSDKGYMLVEPGPCY